MISFLAALVLAAHPHPSGADAPRPLSQRERETARAASEKGEGERETLDQVARRYGLAGEVLVARGGKVLLDRGYGTVDPEGGAAHRAGERWRLASITKQVTATMIVRDFGTTLDRPMGPRLDFKRLAGFDQLTLRHLLTQHSDLSNPDNTPPNAAGVPAFYQSVDPSFGHCFSAPPGPGSAFAYNNCYYPVAASLLGFEPGRSLDRRWPIGMTIARLGETGVPGFVAGRPEPHYELASFGAAGDLMGTAALSSGSIAI